MRFMGFGTIIFDVASFVVNPNYTNTFVCSFLFVIAGVAHSVEYLTPNPGVEGSRLEQGRAWD